MSSLVLALAGGGGQAAFDNTNAILRVQAPSGSNVSISKSGVTKASVGFITVADSDLTDYYFIIKSSEFNSTSWSISATRGTTESTSGTITIGTGSAGKEYFVQLYYQFWLYNNGNEYTSVTGGWMERARVTNYTASGTFTKDTDNIYCASKSGGSSGISTTNAIDFTNYSTLYFKYKVKSGNLARYKIASSLPTSDDGTDLTATTSYQTVSVDISNITGLQYFIIGDNTSTHNGVYLQQVWLE